MKPMTRSIDDAATLFGRVPALPATTKASKAKRQREEVDLGPGLDYLAALMVCGKAITETAEQMQQALKHQVLDRFAVTMQETGKRPESFVGTSGRATASCELRRASPASKLSEDTVQRLATLDIPYGRKETVAARLVINPAIVSDQDILRIVAEALRNEPRLKDVTVVMKQEAEFYHVVAEDTLDRLATTAQDANLLEIRELLEKVSTVAIGKFALKNTEPERLVRRALEIITEAQLLQ